jgi:hypothetical protein
MTLFVAASSQGAHFEWSVGLGESPYQAWNIATLPFRLLGGRSRNSGLACWGQQIVPIWLGLGGSGFWTEVATSILPPRVSRSWETKNLSMCEIAERGPNFLLSKVNSFVIIFRKLSNFQAFNNSY